jgi:hypothetical protein
LLSFFAKCRALGKHSFFPSHVPGRNKPILRLCEGLMVPEQNMNGVNFIPLRQVEGMSATRIA